VVNNAGVGPLLPLDAVDEEMLKASQSIVHGNLRDPCVSHQVVLRLKLADYVDD
jgi:hypothetical protein